jgi:FKBP-type peptidyl-prolyl cis-trans isomerase 2
MTDKVAKTIQAGDVVQFQCQGFLDDGRALFDEDDDDNTYQLRAGQSAEDNSIMAKSISQALVGMQLNDSKRIRIAPEAAFGAFQPELVIEVPSENLSQEVKTGDMVDVEMDRGNGMENFEAIIRDTNPNRTIIDLNHPLAGTALYLDIQVVALVEPESA